MPSSVSLRALHSFPTRRSSDLLRHRVPAALRGRARREGQRGRAVLQPGQRAALPVADLPHGRGTAHRLAPRVGGEPAAELRVAARSEEHTSELQSLRHLVCRLLSPSALYTLSLHDALPIFFGTVFPLLSEAVRGVKVSVGAPFFNQVNVPLFLSLIFLMGVGPLIAWRRASAENLRRNFVWPVLTGIAAATLFWILGVRSALAALSLALTVFVASTIAVDFVRATRARQRTGRSVLHGVAGLLVRHNRRYGGFIVHLGILVITLGVTGSQAWSVQTESTLRQGDVAQLAGFRVRFDGLEARQESNHFRVVGNFTVS